MILMQKQMMMILMQRGYMIDGYLVAGNIYASGIFIFISPPPFTIVISLELLRPLEDMIRNLIGFIRFLRLRLWLKKPYRIY